MHARPGVAGASAWPLRTFHRFVDTGVGEIFLSQEELTRPSPFRPPSGDNANLPCTDAAADPFSKCHSTVSSGAFPRLPGLDSHASLGSFQFQRKTPGVSVLTVQLSPYITCPNIVFLRFLPCVDTCLPSHFFLFPTFHLSPHKSKEVPNSSSTLWELLRVVPTVKPLPLRMYVTGSPKVLGLQSRANVSVQFILI